MKLVEKMARKLGNRLYGYVDPTDTPITWAISRDLALAALRAMREPSEAMVDSIKNGVGYWEAYIDAAIQEAEAK